jgi:hypothetical protein
MLGDQIKIVHDLPLSKTDLLVHYFLPISFDAL